MNGLIAQNGTWSRCARTAFLSMAFLLLAAQSVSAAESPLPMRLTLVAEADRTGVLRYVTRRYEIVDPKGKAGRVEAKPVATGFELSFVGTIPSAGRVEVTLNLTLTLPKNEKKPGRRPTRTEQFNVAATFEAADGESVLIPGTKDGPAIVVTPRIVTDSLGPEAVFLEVKLPLGGREVSLPAQRLVKYSDLVGRATALSPVSARARRFSRRWNLEPHWQP